MPPEDHTSPGSPGGAGRPARPGKSFQNPRGTRDFYPEEMARRRYIFDAWRKTALRHGFDEIDGPTFEHLDLYTVKSGEGIVNELFSFRRAGGETDFALRPEFTPTLARMVAAKANSLAKPIKWFSVGNFFRAERPQRGRLREFSQWNVDILGDDSPEADAELIACCVAMLQSMGLDSEDVRIRINHRDTADWMFSLLEIPDLKYDAAMRLFDAREKMDRLSFISELVQLGGSRRVYENLYEGYFTEVIPATLNWYEIATSYGFGLEEGYEPEDEPEFLQSLKKLWNHLKTLGVVHWCDFAPGVFRGLAYYTGTVFEVHEADGKERAIAGGGRYDNLVELFGGPPTPAVGFAMGDVVLSLVLQDRGLMPEGAELLDRAGARPDVFVISNGQEESEAALKPTVAGLRRAGLHARHTHRSTRNVGKLLKEASACHARYAAIIESATACTVKNLDTGEETKDVSLDVLAEELQR